MSIDLESGEEPEREDHLNGSAEEGGEAEHRIASFCSINTNGSIYGRMDLFESHPVQGGGSQCRGISDVRGENPLRIFLYLAGTGQNPEMVRRDPARQLVGADLYCAGHDICLYISLVSVEVLYGQSYFHRSFFLAVFYVGPVGDVHEAGSQLHPDIDHGCAFRVFTHLRCLQ